MGPGTHSTDAARRVSSTHRSIENKCRLAPITAPDQVCERPAAMLLDTGGDHAAARHARQARYAPRLAAPPQRRGGQPRLDPLGDREISRRRWLAAGAGAAVIVALTVAAADLRLGVADANTMAKSGDSKDGLVALQRSGIGEGALLPHEILVGSTSDPARVAAAVGSVDGVHGAAAPSR